MNAQASPSPSAHRLDKALFWLRWLFLISAALLILLAQKSILDDDVTHHAHLPISVGIAVAANIVLGVLVLIPSMGDHLLGTANMVVDSLLAALFLWAYEGAVTPFLLLGTLASLAAAYRFGWRGVVAGMALLVAFGLVALSQIPDLHDASTINLGLSLVFLLTFGVLGVVLRSGGWQFGSRQPLDPREIEAQRLRTARERARAIYEMATSLSASLDYRHVLDAAQDIGAFGLREMGQDSRLISAVLLFQGEDKKLKVVTSRRLTPADERKEAPGRRGVLGLALKGSGPVFAGDAGRDPELQNFVAFQETKSVLAIPLRAGFDTYGVLLFGSDQPNAFSDDHVELLTAIGTQATLALQNAVLYQNLLNEKERIVEVEEDARKKLSRDLHDGPTQSVAAIAMRVNYIRRLIERQPQQATEELWKVEELARRTTKEIRHMLFTLRPLVLETQGLTAALGQLVEKLRDTHNTEVTLKAQPGVENYMDTHVQGVVFYIIEEAVNNARKHAQAENIWARLYKRDQFVVVEIEDDGVGFDVGAVDANYDQRGSLGMVNMRERAELIEGTLRIQSATGRGTKITVLMPAHPAGSPETPASQSPAAPPLQLQSQRAAPVTPAPQASASDTLTKRPTPSS